MIKTSAQAIWLLVFICFIWGVLFVLVDRTIEHIPIHSFHTLRFGVAAFCLGMLWRVNSKKQQYCTSLSLVGTGFLLGFVLFLSFSAQTMGLQHTTVSNTGFITSLAVVLVPIISFFILGHHISWRVWLGVGCATVGIYLLTVGENLDFNYGDLLVLLCAVGFATHIVLTDKVVTRYPVLPLCTIQLAAVCLYSAIAAWLTEPDGVSFSAVLTAPVVGLTIFSAGVLGTAFAYLAQTEAQKLLPPYKVGLIFTSEPVFAYFAAVLVLNESLGFMGVSGALLIIASLLIVELSDSDKPARVQVLDQNITPEP